MTAESLHISRFYFRKAKAYYWVKSTDNKICQVPIQLFLVLYIGDGVVSVPFSPDLVAPELNSVLRYKTANYNGLQRMLILR
jgi:hypothetical protein